MICLLARVGNDNASSWTSYSGWYDDHNKVLVDLDANGFGAMVGYGFVFIILMQIVAIMFGEQMPCFVRECTPSVLQTSINNSN